jgi:hypothetical protein
MQGVHREEPDLCSSIGNLPVAERLTKGESRPLAIVSDSLGCAGRSSPPELHSSSACVPFLYDIFHAECPQASERALAERLGPATGGSAGGGLGLDARVRRRAQSRANGSHRLCNDLAHIVFHSGGRNGHHARLAGGGDREAHGDARDCS